MKIHICNNNYLKKDIDLKESRDEYSKGFGQRKGNGQM